MTCQKIARIIMSIDVAVNLREQDPGQR